MLQAAVPQQYPTSATAQLVLDPAQAKYPGNEHVRKCGPENHDGVCYDPTKQHLTYHIYIHRENCEQWEGVQCTDTVDMNGPGKWIPINKPVVTSEEPQP